MCLILNILRVNDENPSLIIQIFTEHLLCSITGPDKSDTVSCPHHTHFPGDLSDFTKSQP